MNPGLDRAGLERQYLAYLDCLNRRDWPGLGAFVAPDAVHNDRPLGLAGYRALLAADVAAIPDLAFRAGLLIVDPPHVACRLDFDCTPVGPFLGLPVNGRRVRFGENVLYRFDGPRIARVWSVIDREAVAACLAPPG